MTDDFDDIFNPNIPSRYTANHTMATPVHPGDIMLETIEELGISIAVAAHQMNTSENHLSKIFNGKIPVSIEDATAFYNTFGGIDPKVIHRISNLHYGMKND